jgi:hypothetical protein
MASSGRVCQRPGAIFLLTFELQCSLPATYKADFMVNLVDRSKLQFRGLLVFSANSQ